MGIIIAVVAVLLIHMERNAVVVIKPNINLHGTSLSYWKIILNANGNKILEMLFQKYEALSM